MSDALIGDAPATATQTQAANRNPDGDFIWYELLTSDADAAKAFYADVVGWTAARFPGSDAPNTDDYTIFSAGPDNVAGLMKNPMPTEPIWLGYIGVDDVDAAVERLTADGGTIHKPAWDTEGVGRMALVADPQGILFYVMRGASDQPSTAFKPMADGHCGWNELITTDQTAALDFYIDQFGWEKGDALPMGEMGDYRFINRGGEMFGAVMNRKDDSNSTENNQRPAWNYYFRVPSIAKAVKTIRAKGGTITFGPQEVPGGDFAVNAIDPQGAAFGLIGPEK